MSEGRNPTDLSNLLGAVLGKKGLRKEHTRMTRVRDAWLVAIGDDLSQHTRVKSLRKGVLAIEVDSSALCHQLAGFRREELLGALQTKLTGIELTDLRFRVGAFR